MLISLPEMEERLYTWFVVNLIAFAVILFAYQFVRAGGFEPYKRGFFCDDHSIALPFKESTVPSPLYHGLSLGVPFVTIVVSAVISKVRKVSTLRGRPHTDSLTIVFPSNRRFKIPGWLRQIISQSFYFGIGYCLTGMFTEGGKRVVGRLRPNFLDVCKPNYTLSDCVNSLGVYQYMSGDKWCTGSSDDIQESRLSWPSGHSSTTVFAATFEVLFLQATQLHEMSLPLRILLQTIAVLLAFLTCLSRISDHKHFWSDVLCGAVLGAVIAVYISWSPLQLFHYHKYLSARDKSKVETRNEVDMDEEESQQMDVGTTPV